MKPSGWRQKLYNGTTVSVFLAMLGSNFKGEHKKSLNFFISCSLKQNKHHPTPPPPKMIFFPNLLLFKVESFEVYTHLPPPSQNLLGPMAWREGGLILMGDFHLPFFHPTGRLCITDVISVCQQALSSSSLQIQNNCLFML